MMLRRVATVLVLLTATRVAAADTWLRSAAPQVVLEEHAYDTAEDNWREQRTLRFENRTLYQDDRATNGGDVLLDISSKCRISGVPDVWRAGDSYWISIDLTQVIRRRDLPVEFSATLQSDDLEQLRFRSDLGLSSAIAVVSHDTTRDKLACEFMLPEDFDGASFTLDLVGSSFGRVSYEFRAAGSRRGSVRQPPTPAATARPAHGTVAWPLDDGMWIDLPANWKLSGASHSAPYQWHTTFPDEPDSVITVWALPLADIRAYGEDRPTQVRDSLSDMIGTDADMGEVTRETRWNRDVYRIGYRHAPTPGDMARGWVGEALFWTTDDWLVGIRIAVPVRRAQERMSLDTFRAAIRNESPPGDTRRLKTSGGVRYRSAASFTPSLLARAKAVDDFGSDTNLHIAAARPAGAGDTVQLFIVSTSTTDEEAETLRQDAASVDIPAQHLAIDSTGLDVIRTWRTRDGAEFGVNGIFHVHGRLLGVVLRGPAAEQAAMKRELVYVARSVEFIDSPAPAPGAGAGADVPKAVALPAATAHRSTLGDVAFSLPAAYSAAAPGSHAAELESSGARIDGVFARRDANVRVILYSYAVYNADLDHAMVRNIIDEEHLIAGVEVLRQLAIDRNTPTAHVWSVTRLQGFTTGSIAALSPDRLYWIALRGGANPDAILRDIEIIRASLQIGSP